jgi:RimJ/RimL family protein N-acetyltransferase
MLLTSSIVSERIILRNLTDADADGAYVAWMSDPEVTRFLESRFTLHTNGSLRAFIKLMREDPDSLLLAIEHRDGGQHIGNIKIGPIDRHHMNAAVGIIVGEKRNSGQGIAAEAIRAVARYAFQSMGLEKLWAGCYAPNVASVRAFEKAGFVREGHLNRHWRLEGNEFVDGILLGRVKD